MKRIKTLSILTLFLLKTAVLQAGITVIDPTLIAANRESATKQLFELVAQEFNQQIGIDQFDDFLARQGAVSEPTAEKAFELLLSLMESSPVHESSQEAETAISDTSIFLENDNPDAPTIEKRVKVGRTIIGMLDGGEYLAEAAARKALEQQREMRDQSILRKLSLVKSLQKTTESLRAATTNSEVQKLSALILSLNTQLMAIENDLSLASQDAGAAVLQRENETAIATKVANETEKLKFRHAHQRDLVLFSLVE